MQVNFNPLLANISRAVEGNGTYLRYQWQVRYRWKEALDFGAQGFGEMGRWNHLDPTDEQSHRLGPAIFGKIQARRTARRSSTTRHSCSA